MQPYPWERPDASPSRRLWSDYTFEELAALFEHWGFKRANARDLFIRLHRRGLRRLADLESRILPNGLIERLNAPNAPGFEPFDAIETRPSGDGSAKFLYTLHDGLQVESVLMPFEGRSTYCVSSQAGCALACSFCATGAMGFKRHLTAGEIVGQVMTMAAAEGWTGQGGARVNVVFMGMGEPLHNLSNVLAAFDILSHRHGLVISEKDIAVSTAGLVPKIEEMARRSRRPRLMVSIAATTDEARGAIMPVNRAYPLETLLSCLERVPLGKRESIMLSYVLIAGVNDSPEDAQRLAAMSRRFPSIVNLIPMNAHADSPGMDEPDEARLQWFARQLKNAGAFTTIRRSRGRDVAAACGQLAAIGAPTPLPA